MRSLLLVIVMCTIDFASTPSTASIIAFKDDFDGGQHTATGVTAVWSGVTTIQSVQGYSGYGNGSNVFGGNFLRNVTLQKSTLTLSGLPSHSTVDIGFLLAIIDSWDGASVLGNPNTYDDVFTVLLDGVPVFSHAFDEVVVGDTYVPPPNGLVVFYKQLGFDPYPGVGFFDSGYDLRLEPALHSLPHSNSTMTIDWYAGGAGYGGSGDETWGIENLRLALGGTSSVPEPSSFIIFGTMAACGMAARLRQRQHRLK